MTDKTDKTDTADRPDKAGITDAGRRPLRVLAIAAHPDDVELCCAGTLARYAQRGDHVTIAILCKGNSATLDLAPEELVRVRRQEARAAADLLGADLIQLDLADWDMPIDPATRLLVVDAIRQARPDVVFTHYRTDYGTDHDHTYVLAHDAVLVATVPSITTSHPAIAAVPAVFMWEPLGGYGFQPEMYVDITDAFETKVKMLECHASQREWLRRHGGIDFAEYIDTMAKFRGYQAGVKRAEGFVPVKSWGCLRTQGVLP